MRHVGAVLGLEGAVAGEVEQAVGEVELLRGRLAAGDVEGEAAVDQGRVVAAGRVDVDGSSGHGVNAKPGVDTISGRVLARVVRVHLVVHADQRQFSLRDSGSRLDGSGWTSLAVESHRIGVEPAGVAIATARSDLVESSVTLVPFAACPGCPTRSTSWKRIFRFRAGSS